MENLPVHWGEGMFLRPQHFQAAHRHALERAHVSESWDHAYNYGLAKVEINESALGNQRFELIRCHARFRDGTLVQLDWGRSPDSIPLAGGFFGGQAGHGGGAASGPESAARSMTGIDLAGRFGVSPTTRINLTVPRLGLGTANVSRGGDRDPLRYRVVELKVPDESVGGRDKAIEFLEVNAELATDREALAGYELLPICQVSRAGDEKATPCLDPDYIPPVLAIDVWKPLAIDVIRAIYDYIGKSIEVLAAQVRNRGITFSSQMPGDLERVHMLGVLNEGYCRLGCLTFARGVHPFTAYIHLCCIIGQLSIFDRDRRAVPMPVYDHDNLGPIFREAKVRIEALIGALRPYEHDVRYFEGRGQRMQVSIEPSWLRDQWKWYVGIHYDRITETDCQQIFSRGQVDMVLGTTERVETLFRQQLPGLELNLVKQVPRALQTQSNWLFYEIVQSGVAWDELLSARTLALMLRSNIIRNLDRLEGQRQLVLQWQNRPVALELALWAVSPHVI